MARKSGPSSQNGAMSKNYYVYIMASARNGTLYVGVTNNIGRRSWQHHEAIRRETLIKKVETPLEARADRKDKSGLAGPAPHLE